MNLIPGLPAGVLPRGRNVGTAQLPNTRTVSGLTGDSTVFNGVYSPVDDYWESENGSWIYVAEGVWYMQYEARVISSLDTGVPSPEFVTAWNLYTETGTPVVTRP